MMLYGEGCLAQDYTNSGNKSDYDGINIKAA